MEVSECLQQGADCEWMLRAVLTLSAWLLPLLWAEGLGRHLQPGLLIREGARDLSANLNYCFILVKVSKIVPPTPINSIPSPRRDFL